MHRYVTTFALLIAFITHGYAAEVSVPKDLEDWRGWSMQGEEFRRCPYLASRDPGERDSHRCAWPGRLSLTLDARGGEFAQRWEVFADSWVRVPGNLEHWPQNVRLNGANGAVVARDGFPFLLLRPGSHSVSGKLTWSARPESLAIDPRSAVFDLTIDGRRVTQPERPGGDVWLGKRRTSEQPARMEVQVYRLVQDDAPVRLLTRMRLQVSGDGREELLARVLPDGFSPLWLQSALPARLEPDGRLRVQVRAGSWEIDLEARGTGVATRITRPATSEGLWAREEVWSFLSDDRLRVAAAQGPEGIDPVQANVPPTWRGYPAFRMTQDSALEISERSRGLQHADDNRLTLFRQLWLDFDHRGLTAVDRVSGEMRKDWRLEMVSPYVLQSARVGQDSLLITRNPGRPGSGMEVRSPQLSLEAVVRTAKSRGAMPATGWNARFDQVHGQLNLPPGHRLIAALGADRAPGAWVEGWGLWGLFGVLVVAVFAGWLAGPLIGAVAFVALLLTYQESPAYIWLWSNLLVALALARAAPEGHLLRFARRYRVTSFAVLGIALLPLLFGQARLALHPQLDAGGFFAGGPMEEVTVTGAKRDVVYNTTAQRISPPPSSAEAPPAEAPMPTSVTEDAVAPAIPDDRPVENPYSAKALVTNALGGAVSGGLNSAQVIQRYAPGTLVQTGPGIPAWRYLAYAYEWSGPVDPQQSVRFIFIGPVLLGIWRLVGVALLAALFLALLTFGGRSGSEGQGGPRNALARLLSARGSAASAFIAPLLMAAVFAIGAPSPALAAAPEQDILEQLKARLTQPPDCAPTCAEVMSAQITVRGDRLDVSLQVSALTTIAVPVPSAGDRWQLDTVTLDERSALAIGRESEGTLAVALTPGAHTIRLSGALAAAQSIQLEFPSPPRVVSVSSEGWDASGVNEGRLLSGSLEMVRRRTTTGDAGPLETATEFPAFVRVTRTFDLGLDWSIATTVERVAPAKAAMTVDVPLLKGESELSASLRTRDLPDGRRLALVGLERGQPTVEWSSGLARSESLELELPAEAARSEVWSFVVSPQWNVTFEGMPAVLPLNTGSATWTYEFHPRPGEKLRANITRPERAEGSTLALDSVHQLVQFGKRSATTTLQFQYRSTQGGRHSITLPKTARVTSVLLDDQSVQVRPDDGTLSVGLLPGAHAVKVVWETPSGASLRAQPEAVDLHASASNVETRISVPGDRWPLFVAGAGVGPAVLYWSELVAFALLALALGRWKRSPLRTHEWLLLGFGLSTLSWAVLALVGVWLFALEWRQRWDGGTQRWRFNAVQIALAALTVIAAGTLVFSGIRQSLLASPDMGISGPGSYGTSFAWFLDRVESALPQPTVISVPMWVYRGLMFAWALWLVLALLRWLRWAWQAWKTNGIWRSEEPAAS